jgi:hypothetical protein
VSALSLTEVHMWPYSIQACPAGGFIVTGGGFYDARSDSRNGIAFAGTKALCLAYIDGKLTLPMRSAKACGCAS